MMDLPEGQEWVFEMVNNILIEVLGTIAEQERETTHQRQAEGIAAAKAKGVKLGRPALAFPANPPNASEVIGTIIKDAIINPITGYTNPLYKEINRVS